jgi:hypothetical protein
VNTLPPTCAQCDSELIVISSVTEKLEGSIFPQTITLYRCSNIVCQEARDKETEKRLKQKEEKVVADQRRADERNKKRVDYFKQKTAT